MNIPRPDYTENLFKGADPKHFGYARQLRLDSTDAETTLWAQVRSRKVGGYKFRRQHPVGGFVADFYCHEATLVVELDGAVHDPAEQKEYDASRTYVLNELGVRVIRFTNNEVEDHIQRVIQQILDHLST